MDQEVKKSRGAYYTPDAVVAAILKWTVRSESDAILDPACGDGRFIANHRNSVGVERDPAAAIDASVCAPHSTIHVADFFDWATHTSSRFDCAIGNPPFIRYQRFAGDARARALKLCQSAGVQFSGLASSWAPFLVGSATLLKPGGRMGFVVPAEIGHAPYAKPLLSYLASHFSELHIAAYREKMFTDLSEDAWILYAAGFGGRTNHIFLSARERFNHSQPSKRNATRIDLDELRQWNFRLRPFFISRNVRELYRMHSDSKNATRFGDVARIGIGYVTGANEFFHLRPSQVSRLAIPKQCVLPTVRSGRWLTNSSVTSLTVDNWLRRDEPVLLLRLKPGEPIPSSVAKYLDSSAGMAARTGYKCRNRRPWYAVPDVLIPDAFMSYMSGAAPALVKNAANCACTNSVHAVRLLKGYSLSRLQRVWTSSLTRLSFELEGHPLGGGMLKIEPREATRILISPAVRLSDSDARQFEDAIELIRRWRHHG